MPLEIRVKDAGAYLSVRVAGRATLIDMFDMIDEVVETAIRLGARRVLVDQRQIEEDFKFTDHFAIGERVVSLFGGFEKAASLVREERRTGTSERVAQIKGAQLRVFTNEDVARSWLESD